MDFVWAGTLIQKVVNLEAIQNFRCVFCAWFWRYGITFSVIGMELVADMLQNKNIPYDITSNSDDNNCFPHNKSPSKP
jgi:hypothetical protein